MTKRRLLGLPLGVLGMSIVIALALSVPSTQPTPTDSYAWHNDFALMVSDIRAESPDGFSAGGISGDNAAWVAFSGAVSSGTPGHVHQFQDKYPNITVEFITDVGFTEAQAEAALRAAHYAVFNSSSVADASSSFDFQARRIDITANVGTDTPPGSLVPSLRQDAEAAVAEAAGPEMLDLIGIEVVG